MQASASLRRFSILLHLRHVRRLFLLDLILINNLPLDRLTEDIDLGTGEVPSINLPLEKQVQLRKGAALGFRDAEEGVHDAEEADSSPEEASVVTPVPRARVEHVGR